MTNLLLHPNTQKQLDELISNTPHAIIISGGRGSGKKTTALFAAKRILQREKLDDYPYFLQILPENQSIGIDVIRQINAFLGKKTTGNNSIRRIVIIGDAQTMTTEAQNALLKVLEEPPADTMLMLTTNDLNALKATILSRAQHMPILPVTKQTAIEVLIKQGYSEQAISTAYHMSSGHAGLLVALLEQKSSHELVVAISAAKDFLRISTFEKLLRVDNLAKQKEHLSLFLEGLQRVIASGLKQAALKNNHVQVKKFHSLSSQLQQAQSALSKKANAKLVLSNLFLQM